MPESVLGRFAWTKHLLFSFSSVSPRRNDECPNHVFCCCNPFGTLLLCTGCVLEALCLPRSTSVCLLSEFTLVIYSLNAPRMQKAWDIHQEFFENWISRDRCAWHFGSIFSFSNCSPNGGRFSLVFYSANAAHLKSVQYIHQDFLGYCKAYNTSSNPNCNWQFFVCLFFACFFFVFSFEFRVCVFHFLLLFCIYIILPGALHYFAWGLTMNLWAEM